MNGPLLTCESFDQLLADYLEGTLDLGRRELVEHHLNRCDRCAALVRDLMAIQRQARSLPDLVPSRDLWQGIAERIEAPVLSIPAPAARRRRGDREHRCLDSLGDPPPQVARRHQVGERARLLLDGHQVVHQRGAPAALGQVMLHELASAEVERPLEIVGEELVERFASE